MRLPKACFCCHKRKIKCNGTRPCSFCKARGIHCDFNYAKNGRKRPTYAEIDALRLEVEELKQRIQVEHGNIEGRLPSTDSFHIGFNGQVSVYGSTSILYLWGQGNQSYEGNEGYGARASSRVIRLANKSSTSIIPSPENVAANAAPSSIDANQFANTEAADTTGVTVPLGRDLCLETFARDQLNMELTEDFSRVPFLHGVDPGLAKRLLNLHWERQHHSFLVTYRPLFTRDLFRGGGPYCNEFLFHTILACVSKFSDEINLEDFLPRVEKLLPAAFFEYSIPNIQALLLLGATYNSQDLKDKAWMCTGSALRMAQSLGLHLDSESANEQGRRSNGVGHDGETFSASEIEIRRRVFWAAFAFDRLQSLYMGRPAVIQVCDITVSPKFRDFSEEEMEINGKRVCSVSAFFNLSQLMILLDRIWQLFYVARSSLLSWNSVERECDEIDEILANWRTNLDSRLCCDSREYPLKAPNVVSLNLFYHMLCIMLHRPFLRQSPKRSSVPNSTKHQDPNANYAACDSPYSRNCYPQDSTSILRHIAKCNEAANAITGIVWRYRTEYSLMRAPYFVAYALYVAFTIHCRNCRNTGQEVGDFTKSIAVSLVCLEDLCIPNKGLARVLNQLEDYLTRLNLSTVVLEEISSEKDALKQFDPLLDDKQAVNTGGRGRSNFWLNGVVMDNFHADSLDVSSFLETPDFFEFDFSAISSDKTAI